MSWMQWAPYVPVAQRRANTLREMEKLRKKGKDIQPIRIEGRKIARSFWGKGWCDHLESFSDFENRLPRGRTYVRNGSVCHLDIQPRRIEAIVSGSELYNVRIDIKKLEPAIWKSVKAKCSGRIGSMLELLQGRLSDQVMTVVTDREQGLFPQPDEIELKCDCPDWAVMCKHVAAALSGVGSQLDDRPELLFLLRDVDAEELISTEMAVPAAAATGDVLDNDQLGDIFGIDLDDAGEEQPVPTTKSKTRKRAAGFSPREGATKRSRAGKHAASTRTKKKPRSTKRSKSAAITVKSAPTAGKPAPTKGKSGASRNTGRKVAVRKQNFRAALGSQARGGRVGNAAPSIRPTGKSIVRLRRRLGLSAAEFARQLGVSATTVSRWEAATGRLKLQARPLAALAKLQQQARGK